MPDTVTVDLTEHLHSAVTKWAALEGLERSEAIRCLLAIALLHELADRGRYDKAQVGSGAGSLVDQRGMGRLSDERIPTR